MNLLKRIMKSVMNLINKISIIIFIGGSVLLLFSWNLRSFQLLLIAIVLFTLGVAIKFQKIRVLAIPIFSIGLMLTIAEYLIPSFLQPNQALVTYAPGSSYTSGNYYQRIPKFGYRLSPGIHTSGKLTKSGETIYDVVYTIGPDGYRKDVVSESYDAFIYGGSYVFGEGLNDNETLSYFLNKNHGISAKNLGVHGYGLHQALYNIQQGVTSSKPGSINILVTAPWHSLRSSCKKSYSNGTPRYIFQTGSLKHKGVCNYNDQDSFWTKIISKSNIMQLIKQATDNNDNTITDDDMQLYIEIIKEIKSLSVKNNALLIIAYIGAADERLSNTKWTNESLIVELADIADNLVDISLADKRENLDQRFYIHELDQHPSALANEHRAELLHKVLINDNLN